MGLLGWTGDNGDPDNFFCPARLRQGAKAGPEHPEMVQQGVRRRLIARPQADRDKAERTKLYEEAQVIFKEEAPGVTIAHSTVFEPVQQEGDRTTRSARSDAIEFDGVDIEANST